jgi:HlyD family secretion protein/biotin/lipoyl-binding protein
MHATQGHLQAQLIGLSSLIQLIKRARHAARAQELAFVMVNETHALIPYRQAALWRADGRIVAVSGNAVVEPNAPFVLWLKRMCARLNRDGDEARAIGAADLGAGPLAEEWAEWLPAHALWLPLTAGERRLGALMFARDEPFSDGDVVALRELADGYAHAWAGFVGRRRWWLGGQGLKRRLIKFAALAAILALMFVPISLTALAPAEVVSFKPTVVRAPLDGVVDHFAVQPNDEVKDGQLLLELDSRAIKNRLDIAREALKVAAEEFRVVSQQAFFDEKSRGQQAVLKGRMDQKAAEVAYAQSLLERVQVVATRAGIAVFEDPNEWVGKPVSIGERLLEIADPAEVEIEIWLPVADAIALKLGTEVEFFLNIAPDAPLVARLRQTSYQAAMSPGNVLGYRLKAEFADRKSVPRIGLRGTAKLYGTQVTLIYYLMRRPLAAARQFFGL